MADTEQIDVYPPHGFVRLVDWVGDELAVVNAARVSFHKRVSKMAAPDEGLIRFLLKNKHGTPFEMGFMSQWHFRVPIFVMREWVRHRIGFSYNEESARYVEMRNDFFIPEGFRSQVGRPGHYSYEPIEDRGLTEWAKGEIILHSQRAFDLYRKLLDQGIAKEQARMVLPLNLYTEARWSANARSMMNFLALRNAKGAMQEIQDFANAIEGIFAAKMPTTYSAFVENGRVAP